MQSSITRRQLFRLGLGSLGLFGAGGRLAQLGLLNAQVTTPTTDYKAIVCVFLAGGNDSNAFVESVGGWEAFVGKCIASVDDPNDHSYGCTVTIKSAEGNTAEITFVHDHNGYYGYRYGLSFARKA